MKKFCNVYLLYYTGYLKSIKLFMKLTVVLTLITTLSASALVYPQNGTMNLTLEGQTIKEVIKAIEKKSSYRFFFSDDLNSLDNVVSIDAKEENLETILYTILKNTSASYKVIENNMVIISSLSMLQQVKISGTVTDANTGEPLPGVNILVEGTMQGVVTDVFGKYSIDVADQNVMIDVALTADIQKLDEVIVVGYGTSKRRDIVGSIAKVSNEMITKNPVISVAQSLQGLASGVYVNNSSGHPGSGPEILIRGRSSINLSSGPLWIIDGVPVYTGTSQLTTQGVKAVSALSMINPNDIESIEVLKDAAATSIYGNRASGGVILVTTKSNKGGLTGVNINYDGGISRLPFNESDFYVDTKTWWDLTDQAWANSGNTTVFQPSMLTDTQFLDEKPNLTREEALATDIDHLSALIQKSRYHQFGFTANKGFQTGGVMFSLNYRDEKGLLRNNNLQKLTTRFNFNFDPKENLHLGITSNFMYLKNSGVSAAEGKGGAGWGNLMVMLPWYQLYDPNSQTGYWMSSSGYNPLASSDKDLMRNDLDVYQAISSAFAKWDTPIKGLSVKSEAGVDLLLTNSSHWRSVFLDPDAPFQNQASERSVVQRIFNYNAYLSYEKTSGSHNLNITTGAEATRSSSYTRQVDAVQISSEYPELINPLKINYANGSFGDGGYLMGLFGRANYKFKDRYILNASIRRDGHSALSKENRWATFTAVGAGWIITDEKFFNVKGINLLKLRGSYGQTGNTSLSKSMTQINWSLSSSRYGGGFLPGGTRIGPIGSTNLKWETTTSLDFGLDFGFFENRISGSAAYYTKNISDLILQGNVQESVGFNVNSVWENIGDMKNWGWEFNVSTVNINKGGFNWRTDFNISFNDNRIIRLNDFEKGKGTEVASVVAAKGYSTIRKEGEKIDTWYLANFVHIDPDRGIAMIEQRDQDVWNNEFITVPTDNLIPMNEANVNANKMIQHGKSALPTYFGGLSNNITYKNFDLNIQFVFAGGNYIMNYFYSRSTNASSQGQIAKAVVGNTWEKPGDIAEFPQLTIGYLYKYDNAGNPSASGTRFNTDYTTFYLEKGDYIKLRNIQLGYTIPATVTKKAQLQQVRLYVGASNLFTLTKFRGFDPESNDDLPIPRSFNFGCSVNL